MALVVALVSRTSIREGHRLRAQNARGAAALVPVSLSRIRTIGHCFLRIARHTVVLATQWYYATVVGRDGLTSLWLLGLEEGRLKEQEAARPYRLTTR